MASQLNSLNKKKRGKVSSRQINGICGMHKTFHLIPRTARKETYSVTELRHGQNFAINEEIVGCCMLETENRTSQIISGKYNSFSRKK